LQATLSFHFERLIVETLIELYGDRCQGFANNTFCQQHRSERNLLWGKIKTAYHESTFARWTLVLPEYDPLRRKATFSLLILFCLSGGWFPKAAQSGVPGPGDLDPTYGTDGKVITEFTPPPSIGGAALQPDGKTVIAGGAGPTNFSVVARYTLDGSPDLTFGSGGRQTSPFTVFVRAVAIQPDGKIIVGGLGQPNLPFSAALFRLNPDGSTDTTFGSGGLVIVNFPEESSIYDLAVLPDGRILACGEVFLDNSFMLIRLNTSGTLDPSFGNGGTVRAKMGPTNPLIGGARAIAIQPDLKIVAVGFAENSWAIARFHPNGQLDETFSNDGKILLNFGIATEQAEDVVIQPDGKIVVAGVRSGPTAAVARLNSDGSIDDTFGSGANGVVQPLEGINRATSLVLDPSGKILVAGDGSSPSPNNFILMRLNIDGSKDTSFAGSGIVFTDVGLEDHAVELLRQSDGKVVLVGQSTSNGSGAFVLARYLTVAPDEPVLQIEAGSNHAIAFDSVTFQRDPFFITNDLNLSPDHRTRIILFAANLNSAAVTVQAEDSAGVHNLPVEFVGKVPGLDWLTQVVVKLPDGLAKGSALVSVSFNGKTSNKGTIVIE